MAVPQKLCCLFEATSLPREKQVPFSEHSCALQETSTSLSPAIFLHSPGPSQLQGLVSNKSRGLWRCTACQVGKVCSASSDVDNGAVPFPWNMYPTQLHALLHGPPGCPGKTNLPPFLKRDQCGPPGVGDDEEKVTILSFIVILVP